VWFEPTISAGERPQTYALDRAATGTGDYETWNTKFSIDKNSFFSRPCIIFIFSVCISLFLPLFLHSPYLKSMVLNTWRCLACLWCLSWFLTAGLFLSSVTFVLVICRVITLSDHQSVSVNANDSLCLSIFRSEIIYVILPELFEVTTCLTSVLNYQQICLPWRRCLLLW
jgi:hypothetical protein